MYCIFVALWSNQKDTNRKICRTGNIFKEMVFWQIYRKYLNISLKMWIACWTWGARRPMKVLTTSLHQSIQKTVFMVDLSQLLLEWQQLCRRKTLVMMPFLRFVDLFAVMFMYMNIHKIAFCLNFHCINIQVIYIIKTFFIK